MRRALVIGACLSGCSAGMQSPRVLEPRAMTAGGAIVVVPNAEVSTGGDTTTEPVWMLEAHARRGLVRRVDGGVTLSRVGTFSEGSATAVSVDGKVELVSSARWAMSLAVPITVIAGPPADDDDTEIDLIVSPTVIHGVRLGRHVELLVAPTLGVVLPVRAQFPWTTTQLTYGFGLGARIGGTGRWSVQPHLSAVATTHLGRLPGYPDEDDVDDGAVFAVAGIVVSRRLD